MTADFWITTDPIYIATRLVLVVLPVRATVLKKALYKRFEIILPIWPRHSRGPSEQKSIKNMGEKGAWSYPGTAEIFSVPPIISGTGKATNFKFYMYILSIDWNKNSLQISGNVAVC